AWWSALFFFQAEDGIRDFHVTGVQTCALPIYGSPEVSLGQGNLDNDAETDDKLVYGGVTLFVGGQPPVGSEIVVQAKNPAEEKRSEERRVGKECRAGGSV